MIVEHRQFHIAVLGNLIQDLFKHVGEHYPRDLVLAQTIGKIDAHQNLLLAIDPPSAEEKQCVDGLMDQGKEGRLVIDLIEQVRCEEVGRR